MRCRASAWNFTRSFILQDFFFTLGTPIFRNTWECYQHAINIWISAAVAQSWRALHGSLLKIAIRHRCFSKNFAISAEQRYWKTHFDGCFCEQLYFGNFPEWLLLKDSCKDIFIHGVIILNRSNNSLCLYLKIYWNRQVFDLIRASGIWKKPETLRR